MRILYLHVKQKYFDQIKSGEKLFEFRCFKTWKKAIEGREYDVIEIMAGYPKKADTVRRLQRQWMGYEVQKITHEHFGPEPYKVFAIRVN